MREKNRELGIEICMILFILLMGLSVKINFVAGFFLNLIGFLMCLKIVVWG